MSWILQFFEALLKVYHSISKYLNLLNHNHGFPRQAWQIRNSRFRGCLPSCATRNCHLQFLVCDDESRSRIFLYHDLSKSIWSAIDHSMMVLAPQCREQQSRHFQCSRLDHFLVCIDRCEWSWLLMISWRCVFFAHWRASSPSVILKKSRNLIVFWWNFAAARRDSILLMKGIDSKFSKFWSIRFPEASGNLGISTNDLRSSCLIWISLGVLRALSGLSLLAFPESASGCFFTQLCACSVNTELVCRMDSSGKKINVVTLSIEVDSISTTSHFQSSATQRTYPFEYRVSRILEFHHTWWSTEFPLATIDCISLIPLAFFSETQEYPVSVNESWRIHFDFSRIDYARVFVPFLVQIDVVEHGHEDYSIAETFRSDALSFMVFLNFLEKFRSCGSWENLSLECNRLSIVIIWKDGTSVRLTLAISIFWLQLRDRAFFTCIALESEYTFYFSFVQSGAWSICNVDLSHDGFAESFGRINSLILSFLQSSCS